MRKKGAVAKVPDLDDLLVNRIWDRIPEEELEAYQAFLVYLDVGEGRTLSKAYRVLHPGKAPNAAWKEWSKTYNWPDRAVAYDAFLLRKMLMLRALRKKLFFHFSRRVSGVFASSTFFGA